MRFFAKNLFAVKSVVPLLLVLILPGAHADPFGVIYPRSHGPYQTVFRTIITGVESELKSPSKKLLIDDNSDLNRAGRWLKDNDIRVLVLLGNQSLEFCEGLQPEAQLIAGAILSPPSGQCALQSGIALAPHPDSLFKALLSLKPGIRTVHVVYNPAFNKWLIDYAERAARKHGLELHSHTADSLDQAAKIYRAVIDAMPGDLEAIWLPQDPYTVDQQTILPALLKEAWNREFVIFSSNAAHVKRGVLFGLYPDFQAMGQSLGRMARQYSQSNNVKKSSIQPLTDLLIAVNLRTADHLELNLSASQRESFDLTFPASR